MKRFLSVVALCIAMSACSSENDARSALDAAGYTDITITGYRVFGCGKEDSFHTGFTAKGPNGKYASGVVCSDWLKGSTIRLD